MLLILSSRLALTRKYGPAGFAAINDALRALENAGGVGTAVLAYVDDESTLRSLGIKPVNPRRPSAICSLVEKVEANLGSDARVSVLIAGGPSVVPFFRLDNPADDPDEFIFSDACYAGLHGDPLRPVRPVSRVPDTGHVSADFFARILSRMAAQRATPPRCSNLASVSGYTASVWREAARDVYSTAQSPATLRMSPPWDSRDYCRLRSPEARIHYFNLHGKPDGLVWYGQRDPSLVADYPDFPIALRTLDICSAEASTSAVLTEACYGATLAPNSIANRYVHLGASAFLGSTAMSYGSVSPPVSGADFLAKEVLRRLLAGSPIGESFLKAKQSFVNTMMAEQGFLDAEDQKTMLTFILLGDPLFSPMPQTKATASRSELELPFEPQREIICARNVEDPRPARLRPGVLEELEYLATRILSAADSDRSIGPLRTGQESCSNLSVSSHIRLSPGGRRVLTIRQTLPTGGTRLARVSYSGDRVVKALVSK